jgi:hypothetical protein
VTHVERTKTTSQEEEGALDPNNQSTIEEVLHIFSLVTKVRRSQGRASPLRGFSLDANVNGDTKRVLVLGVDDVSRK